MKKTNFEKKLNLKFSKFNIYKYNPITKESKLLGVVIATNCPDAVGRGWKKFKIKRKEMSLVYARKNIKINKI